MDGQAYTKIREGFTATAKPDTGSKFAVGYGFDYVNEVPVQATDIMTRSQADAYFPTPYSHAEAGARAVVGPCFLGLDVVRKAALTDMAYELGPSRLADFHHMILAVNAHQWAVASASCLASVYANQVPERAAGTAHMLLTGNWPDDVMEGSAR